MKMKLLTLRIFFLVCITGIILSSCKKKDTAADSIVGIWTAGTSTVSVLVGTKTLTQYFIDEIGLTADQAKAFNDSFDASVKESFTGTMELKSNNTYTSNMGGSTDTGTWILNSGSTKLTITSTVDGPVTYDVVELTSSKLHLKASETTSEDLNGDSVLEILTVNIDINFSK